MTRARYLFLATFGTTVAALTFGAMAGHAELTQKHDSNAPVDFTADRIEVQDRADRVVVSGNVQVTQADMHLTSDRLVVAYTRAGGTEINRMDAFGNVVVTQGKETARGNVGIYDLDKKLITMVGNVELTQQGGNRLTGNRLLIDLNSGRSSVDGRTSGGIPGSPSVTSGSGGRVSGTFKVKQQTDKQNSTD